MSYPQLNLPSLSKQVDESIWRQASDALTIPVSGCTSASHATGFVPSRFNSNPGCRHFTLDKAEWIDVLNFPMVLNGA